MPTLSTQDAFTDTSYRLTCHLYKTYAVFRICTFNILAFRWTSKAASLRVCSPAASLYMQLIVSKSENDSEKSQVHQEHWKVYTQSLPTRAPYPQYTLRGASTSHTHRSATTHFLIASKSQKLLRRFAHR